MAVQRLLRAAPDLLRPLARKYMGPDVVFPPGDNPPEGFITRVSVERVVGIGPGAPIRSQSTSITTPENRTSRRVGR